MSIGRPYLIVNSLLFFAVFSTAFLNSLVFADDTAEDNVSVNVPVSCTMNGTGMTSHTASIPNGTYQANIGTTTLQSFCNDSQGFAIYAIGYTNEEYGNTNLVGLTQNQTIVTGTATSTGNPDVSNWAVKLATSSGATYPLTLDNSFGSYHTVPTDYTKVAHRDSGTDLGSSATGSTLTTTYAAYISKTQAADTYNGKVKYTLVHPSTGPEPVYENQVGVIYDGNGQTFPGGASNNRVVYGDNCVPTYVGTTPSISKTPNVNNDGTATSGYQYNYTQKDPVTFTGAIGLKVEISYGVENNYDFVYVFEGSYNGDITDHMDAGQLKTYNGYSNGFEPGASETFYVNGNTVTFAFFADDYEDDGYYGYYAKVYPIYDTEQSGTEVVPVCELGVHSGAYTTTTAWKGKWYILENNEIIIFVNEAEVMSYIDENSSTLYGTTITLHAYNPYFIVYDGNGATAGTMSGFTTDFYSNTEEDMADLMAYNFKKTGYGFAGWSVDQNATVNSSSKIYGPNETVFGDEFIFDSNTRQVTLYAVWVQSSGNMQNYSCDDLSRGQVVALTDNRDNNVYTVGKLADGNCWMMENLRLDNTAATLTTSNTNASPLGFTSLSATSDQWCASNSAYCANESVINTNNINIGGVNASGINLVVSPGIWNSRAKMTEEERDTQDNEGNTDHNQWYSYGNYYNWYSATAGEGLASMSNADVDDSICPKGWSMPIGGVDTANVNGSYAYLDVQLGGSGGLEADSDENKSVSNRWRRYPNNFIYSGYWSSGRVSSRGDKGVYWSPNIRGGNIRTQWVGSTSINPGNGSMPRYHGAPMRCIVVD